MELHSLVVDLVVILFHMIIAYLLKQNLLLYYIMDIKNRITIRTRIIYHVISRKESKY